MRNFIEKNAFTFKRIKYRIATDFGRFKTGSNTSVNQSFWNASSGYSNIDQAGQQTIQSITYPQVNLLTGPAP
jgi:hypothetical protein